VAYVAVKWQASYDVAVAWPEPSRRCVRRSEHTSYDVAVTWANAGIRRVTLQ
jgi:hypothetical protein